MTQPCPTWVQFYIAFVLFAYMTFDAVDGKQARKTGTSTPLGQLFDHGCDAINLIFTVFMTWGAFAAPPSMMMAMSGIFCIFVEITLNVGYLVFLVNTWEEHHTHVLSLATINGPIEGSLLMSLAAIVSGFFGSQIWNQKHTIYNFEYVPGSILYVLIGFGSTGSIAVSVMNAINARGLKHILPSLISTLAPLYACLFWFGNRPELWNSKGHVLFLLHSGFTATNIIFHIIMATVTRAPFPHFNLSLATVFAGLLHCALCKINCQIVGDHFLLLVCALVSLGLNLRMAISIIDQVCEYLHIRCLTITNAKNKVE